MANFIPKKVDVIEIKGLSSNRKISGIEVIKSRNYYVVENETPGGAAPKDVVRIYDYPNNKTGNLFLRSNYKKWPAYIAKVGHKHYPDESITEYLFYIIGLEAGFNVAHGRLCILNNQVRFLSKIFNDKNREILVHGADLFSDYLNGDPDFVEKVEEEKKAHNFFTIQFIFELFEAEFKKKSTLLKIDFLKMVLYDCLTGNNDRHYYNWGILKPLNSSKESVRFSPIYDTARGLFWNTPDPDITKKYFNKNNIIEKEVYRYIINSTSKIGFEGKDKLSHIELLSLIISEFDESLIRESIIETFKNIRIKQVIERIRTVFGSIIDKNRLELVCFCLSERYSLILQMISKL